MKKNLNLFFAAFAAFAIVLSCAKEENPVNTPQDGDVNLEVEMTPMTISATLSDVMTKVSFDPTYDGGKPQSLALAWEEDDQLRIYNHADKTQYADFELDPESVGQKTGRFTGTIFSAQSYDVEVICGEVEYAAQTQPADGETSALKYCASATDVTSLSSITFTELSSVLAITAKMPEDAAAGIASVDITASEAIFSTGKTLTINLAQKGDAGEDGILHLFANLPKGNQQIAEGTTLLVRFNAPETEHTVYTRFVELDAAAFTAGKLNTININATESETHAGLTSCDGTSAEKAYLIGDKYQLQAMSSLMNADATTYFRMVADVDLENADWTSVDATAGVSFDGANHKISNYTADGGLFSTLAGSVKNLAVDGATVSTKTNAPRGLLADNASGVEVKNITVTNSSLTAVDYIGGLIGVMDGGTVENVDFACPVTGGATVGGFIGHMKNGSLKNVAVTGKLTCTYQRAGGLVALIDKGTVENCSFTADLDYTKSASYALVGGLIGQVLEGSITGSYTTGKVSATKGAYVGGLVGNLAKATVTMCYATGDVSAAGGTHHVGGLIGYIDGDAEISQCYATGSVGDNSANRRGGLVGSINAGTVQISNSYSSGSVSSSAYSGGFIGGCESTATVSVIDSYTKSSISGATWTACVFSSSYVADVKGFIGWNVSGRKGCVMVEMVCRTATTWEPQAPSQQRQRISSGMRPYGISAVTSLS